MRLRVEELQVPDVAIRSLLHALCVQQAYSEKPVLLVVDAARHHLRENGQGLAGAGVVLDLIEQAHALITRRRKEHAQEFLIRR